MSNEVRDRLAELEGWTFVVDREIGPIGWYDKDGRVAFVAHPIPDDLTTCAAMWDKYAGEHGWRYSRFADVDGSDNHTWQAYDKVWNSVAVPLSGHDAASELRDRWALLGEVLKARGVW